MENLKIRKAVKTDAENLRNLEAETFYKKWRPTNTEADMQSYMRDNFSIEKINSDLSDNGIIHFLAETETKLVAYVQLKHNSSEGDLEGKKAIEIQRMYVMEEYFRRGIGRKLMNTAIDFAIVENYEVIWLGVWEQNFQAIEFYKSFGYEIYGSHLFVLGEDVTTDLLMKKIL